MRTNELSALKGKTIKRARAHLDVDDNESHVQLDFTDGTDAYIVLTYKTRIAMSYGVKGNTASVSRFLKAVKGKG